MESQLVLHKIDRVNAKLVLHKVVKLNELKIHKNLVTGITSEGFVCFCESTTSNFSPKVFLKFSSSLRLLDSLSVKNLESAESVFYLKSGKVAYQSQDKVYIADFEAKKIEEVSGAGARDRIISLTLNGESLFLIQQKPDGTELQTLD